MSIQETIIDALKTVQAAHSNALTSITTLRSEKTALEAEIARLNAQIAGLRSHVAHLEAEAVKIVEPDSVRTLLASLAQVIAEGQRGALPAPAERMPVAAIEHAGTPPDEWARRDEVSAAPKVGAPRSTPFFIARKDPPRDAETTPVAESVDAAD